MKPLAEEGDGEDNQDGDDLSESDMIDPDLVKDTGSLI